MNVKATFKYYLIFALIFLFGASFAAGLFFAYRLTILTPLGAPVTEGLHLSEFVLLAASMLRPMLLIFLAAFTIYACAVSAFSALTAGMLCGQFVMSYCLSSYSPFTHAAVLVIFLAFGVLFTVTATKSALYRATLRAVAPDPVALFRAERTRKLLRLFLSCAVTVAAFSLAAYFLCVYFPLSSL